MVRQMIGYIKKRPILWGVGLLIPPLASFIMNYGFALGLEYYTTELSRESADFANIVIIMSVTALALVASSIMEDITRYIFSVFIIKTENDIRHDIYKNIVNTRYSLLSSIDRGELYTKYFTDTERATSLISINIFAILFPLVHAIGYFIVLFSINFIVGALIAGLTIAVVLLNLVFTDKFRRLEKKILTAKEDFTRTIDAAVRGKITVRQLQIGDVLTKQISDMADEIYQVGNRNIRLNLYRKISLELLSTICTSLMTPIACILAASNIIELASVVMVAQICRYIIMQTSGLGVAIQQLGTNMVSCERIQKVMELPDEYEMKKDIEDDVMLDFEKSAVTFKHFGVAYKENSVLKDVNIMAERGQIIAIIGSSGSGKTSLIHALMGLIEYNGEIRIFGVNTRDIKLSSLRSHIAYCPEHSQLFGDSSVLENLLYAAPDKTRADIEKLLCSLSLQGLDITQNANTLSGGQRQRIALARALLKDSEIIILDEPTAALDSESEWIILRMLSELKERGKTVILISHRMSTVEIADKFFVISDNSMDADELDDLRNLEFPAIF